MAVRRRLNKKRFIIAMLVLATIIGTISYIVSIIVSIFDTTIEAVVPLVGEEIKEYYLRDNSSVLIKSPGWIYTTEDSNEVLFYQLCQAVLAQEWEGKDLRELGVTEEWLMGVQSVETAGRLEFADGANLLDSPTLTAQKPNKASAVGPFQITTKYFWSYMKFDVKVNKSDMTLTYEVVPKGNLIPEPTKLNRLYYPTVVANVAYYFGTVGSVSARQQFSKMIDECEQRYSIKLNDTQKTQIIYCLSSALYHSGSINKSYSRQLVDYISLVVYEVGDLTNLAHLGAKDSYSFRPYSIGRSGSKGDKPSYEISPYTVNGKQFNEPLIVYIANKYDASILSEFERLYARRVELTNLHVNFTYGIDTYACGAYRVSRVKNYITEYLKSNFWEVCDDTAINEYLSANNIQLQRPHTSVGTVSNTNCIHETYMKTIELKGVTYKFPIAVFNGGRGFLDKVIWKGQTYTFPGRINAADRYDLAKVKDYNTYLVYLPAQFQVDGNTEQTGDMRAIPALIEMNKAWKNSEEYKKSGHDLQVNSGYRSVEKNLRILIEKANERNYLDKNDWAMSNADTLVYNIYEKYDTIVEKQIRAEIGLPSNNSHLTGRCFDFLYCSTDNYLYEWLLKNAKLFGFHNYSFERWHWEYNPSVTVK